MFAVIKTGGKQYLVTQGSTLRVEKLAAEEGSSIEFKDVLMIGESDGSVLTVGDPMVKGASVKATVVRNGRDKKVVVRKFKAKIRYARTYGHRQPFTEVTIDSITA